MGEVIVIQGSKLWLTRNDGNLNNLLLVVLRYNMLTMFIKNKIYISELLTIFNLKTISAN